MTNVSELSIISNDRPNCQRMPAASVDDDRRFASKQRFDGALHDAKTPCPEGRGFRFRAISLKMSTDTRGWRNWQTRWI